MSGHKNSPKNVDKSSATAAQAAQRDPSAKELKNGANPANILSPAALMALGLAGSAAAALQTERAAAPAPKAKPANSAADPAPAQVGVQTDLFEPVPSLQQQLGDLIQTISTEATADAAELASGAMATPLADNIQEAVQAGLDLAGAPAPLAAEPVVLAQAVTGVAAGTQGAGAAAAGSTTAAGTAAATAGATAGAATAAAAGAAAVSAGTVLLAAAGIGLVAAVGSGSKDSGSSTGTKDTTAPASPVINAVASDNIVNDAEKTAGVTVTGTAEAGATVVVSWGTASKTVTATGGTWSATFSSAEVPADASTTIGAVATDAAGNASIAGTKAVTVDTAIATPTVALTTDTGTGGGTTDKITSNAALSLSNVASDVTRSFAVDGGAASANYSAPTSQGSYTVVVTDTDTAGNTASASLTFTLDTASATPVINTVAGNNEVNSTERAAGVAVTGTAEAGASVSVTWGTVTKTITADTVTGDWTAPFATNDLPNDANTTINVVATDVAGNTSSMATQNVTMVSGAVADGYVRGARIWIDTGTTLVDTGINTDANGNFFLPSGLPAGSIVAKGGVNIDTGVPNSMELKAPEGSTAINPLTTLVQAVVDASNGNTSPEAAAAAVASSLGLTLTDGQSLLSYDPLAVAKAGGDTAATANAVNAQKAAAQVATIVTLANNAVGGAGDSVIGGLVTQLSNSSNSGTTVNLADASTVSSLINTAFSAAAAGASEADILKLETAKSAIADASTAIGNATNLSQVSGAQSQALDTKAPDAPTSLQTAAAITNIKSITVSFNTTAVDGTAAVAGDVIVLRDGGVQIGDAVTLTSADIAAGFKVLTAGSLSDGSHSLTAALTDQAGNSSPVSSVVAVTIDTQAPSAPAFNPVTSDNIVNGSEQTTAISGTAESGATIKLALGGQVRTAIANESGAWSYELVAGDITGMGQGTEALQVTATDLAGNISVLATSTITVDTLAPTVSTSVTSVVANSNTAVAAGGATNDNTLQLSGALSGTLTQGDEVVVVYDGTSRLGLATVSGTTWRFDTASLDNSVHSFKAQVEDLAGNQGALSNSYSVTVDATVPGATLTITSATAPTNDTTPTLAGTVENTLAEGDLIKIYDGSTLLGNATVTGGAWSFTPTSELAPGAHQFKAVVQGTGGNQGTPTVASLTIDTTAPLAPVIKLASDTGVSNADSITSAGLVNVTGLEAGATWQYSINSGGTWLAGSSANSVTLQDSGAKTVVVRQTDSVGNIGPASAALNFTLDTAIAPPTINDVATDNKINAAEMGALGGVTLTGTAEAGSRVSIAMGSGNTRSVTASDTGNYSYTLNKADIVAMGQGDKTIQVTAQDAAGNSSQTSKAVTVDTIAPLLSAFSLTTDSDSGIKGDGRSNVTTPSISFTAENGATLDFSTGGSFQGAGTGTGANQTFILPPEALTADGSYTLTLRATDASGNVTLRTGNYTLDTKSPNKPTILGIQDDVGSIKGALAQGAVTDDTLLRISGSAEAFSKVELFDGQASLGTVWADKNGAWSLTTSALIDGTTYNVVAKATDAAGNPSTDSDARSFTIDTTIATPTVALTTDTGASNTDKLTSNAALTLSTAASDVTRSFTVDSGAASANYTAPTSDGIHTVVVTDTDTAGNTANANLTFTLDTTAPAKGTITAIDADGGATGDRLTNDSTPVISVSAEAGAKVGLGSGGNPVDPAKYTVTETSPGQFTITVTQALADGGYGVIVRDAAGNATTTFAQDGSDLATFRIDASAPAAAALVLKTDSGSSGNDGITKIGTIDVSGLEAGASWQYSTDSGNSWDTGSGSNFVLGAGNYAAGAVQVRQTDKAGNLQSATPASIASAITVDQAGPTAIIEVSKTSLKADDTAQVTLTFNEKITGLDSTDLTVQGGTLGALSSADGGKTWTATLTPGTGLESASNTITLANTGVSDLAGNAGSGNTASGIFAVDTKAPVLTPVSPADDGLSLGLAADLVLGANESLAKGTGTVSLFKADGSLVQSFDVAAANSGVTIVGSGSQTRIQINPTLDLVKDEAYYVTVSDGAFLDAAGNPAAGITGSGAWNFTGAGATVTVNTVAGDNRINLVESGAAIAISGTVLASNDILSAFTTTNLSVILRPAVGTDIALTNVVYQYVQGSPASWSATLPSGQTPGDYSLIATIAGTSGAAANVIGSTTQAVLVDTSGPALATSSPTDNGIDVAVGANIVLNFNESIQAGNGNIVISDGTDIRTIAITDASQVTISGQQITINPTNDLLVSRSYSVQMAAGVINDLAGNAYGGISDATTLNFSTPPITGTPGNDSLVGTDGNDTILGLAGDDTLIGGAGNNSIQGGDGTDRIAGGPGADTLEGGAGTDRIRYAAAADLVGDVIHGNQAGGAADKTTVDRLQLFSAETYDLSQAASITQIDRIDLAAPTLAGTTETVKITQAMVATADANGDGVAGDILVVAYDGATNLATLTNLVVDASALISGQSVSVFSTDATGDYNLGNDSLIGGAGNDYLQGGGGADTLIGNDGNDSLVGGAGADTVIGGAGTDRIRYFSTSELTGDVIQGGDGGTAEAATLDRLQLVGMGTYDFNLASVNQIDRVDLAGSQDASSQQTVILTLAMVATADVNKDGIFGDIAVTGYDWVAADAPTLTNLRIDGSALTSTQTLNVWSGNYHQGNDTIIGGAGKDYLEGGPGNDSISGGDGDDYIRAGGNWNDGSDTINGGDGFDIVAYNYIGATQAITFVSTLQSGVQIDPLGGTDSLSGIEQLHIFGGTLADNLTGDSGSNHIQGNEGDDTLTGGGGYDTFAFTGAVINGNDTITDFGVGGDSINAQNMGILTLLTSGDASTLSQGQVLVEVGATQTKLYLGADSTPGADGYVTLQGSYLASGFSVTNDSFGANLTYTPAAPLMSLSANLRTVDEDINNGGRRIAFNGAPTDLNVASSDPTPNHQFSLTDPDSANFGGGTLKVSVTDGNMGQLRLGVITGNGIFSVDSTNGEITYYADATYDGTGGTNSGANVKPHAPLNTAAAIVIGTIDGTHKGQFGDALWINLNSNATPAITQVLGAHISLGVTKVGELASTQDWSAAAGNKTVQYEITDGSGSAPVTATRVMPIVSHADATGMAVVAGTYGTGSTIDVAINFDDVVIGDSTNGTSTLSLDIGGVTKIATFAGGSGTKTLHFTYVVEAGLNDSDGIAVTAINSNGAVLKDVSGAIVPSTFSGPVTFAGALVSTSTIDANTPSAGNDSLVGTDGNDTILGLAGDDSISGGLGNDVINGGDGTDWAMFTTAPSAVTVNLTTNLATGGGGNDTLVSIENVRGSDFNDVLTGNDFNNTIRGEAGNDTILGGGGNDFIIGGAGDDSIDGGAGTSDTVDYLNSTTALGTVTVDLSLGTSFGDGNDTLAGIENVSGTSFNDIITGDAAANRLIGNNGNDSINGGAGDDRLTGGAGADTLIGGTGEDRFFIMSAPELAGDSIQGGTGSTAEPATRDRLILAGMGTYDLSQASISEIDRVDMAGSQDASSQQTVILTSAMVATADVNKDGIFGDIAVTGYDWVAADAPTLTNLRIDGSALTSTQTLNVWSGNYHQGNDTIIGGAGKDYLEGGPGSDSISGGDGDDYIRVGGILNDGSDTIDGGAGTYDVVAYNYGGATQAINFVSTLQSGVQIDPLGGTDQLSGIESLHIFGGTLADNLTGDSGSNYIQGNEGDDTLTGGGGYDTFAFTGTVTNGNDTITDFGVGGDSINAQNMGVITLLTSGNSAALSQGQVLVEVGANQTKVYLGANSTPGADGYVTLQGSYLASGFSVTNDSFGGHITYTGGTAPPSNPDYSLITGTLTQGQPYVGWIENANDSNSHAAGSTLVFRTHMNINGSGEHAVAVGGTPQLQLVIGEAGAYKTVLANYVSSTSDPAGGVLDFSYTMQPSDVGQLAVGNLYLGAGASITSTASTPVNAFLGINQGLTDTSNVPASSYLFAAPTQTGTADNDWVSTGTADTSDLAKLTAVLTGLSAGSGGNRDVLEINLLGTATSTIAGGPMAGVDGLEGYFGGRNVRILKEGSAVNLYEVVAESQQLVKVLNDANGGFERLRFNLVDSAGKVLKSTGAIDLVAMTFTDAIRPIQFTQGSAFADSIDRSASDTSLSQIIWADNGADSIIGTARSDRIVVAGSDTINAGAGDDMLNWWNDAGTAVINGGDGADRLFLGSNFTNSAQGAFTTTTDSAGVHIKVGTTEVALVTKLTAGGDYQVTTFSDVATVGDVIANLTSVETLAISAGSAYQEFALASLVFGLTVTGTSGNDTFSGGPSNDTIYGLAGDDNLNGGSGDDSLDGGLGYDFLESGTGNDTINGGAFTNIADISDTVSYQNSTTAVNVNLGSGASFGSGTANKGVNGTDTLININFVRGSEFADTITGSAGLVFEQFEGGGGNDTIDGGAIDVITGANSNRISYQNAKAAVTLDLAAGTAITSNSTITGNSGTDTLLNFNQVRGSANNDTLYGSNRTDISESFEGRGGNDVIDGRGGIDVVRFSNASGGVTASLVSGTGSGSGVGTDTFTNVEGLFGSGYNDTLTGGNTNSDALEVFRGDAGSDIIDGGSGYDRAQYDSATSAVTVTLNDSIDGTAIDGMGGTDTLRNIEGVRGSEYNDSITGNSADNGLDGQGGNDSLVGGAGNDTIYGGTGADQLTGGDGNDVYAFGTASDSSVTSTDLIIGFASGDMINLKAILGNVVSGAGYTNADGTSTAATGSLQIVTDTGTLGNVLDNQLHLLVTTDGTSSRLSLKFDNNSSAGTTSESGILVIDFQGDVHTLLPAALTYI